MTQPEIDLSQCVTCGRDATFTDADPGANPVSYCTRDVPVHLRARAEAGQLPLQTDDTLEELKAEAKRLDIDGRSSMNKTQLQSAVAAAKLSEANAEEVAARRRDPVTPDRRPDPVPPPAPPTPPTPPRRNADEVDSTELEGGSMGDALPPVEVHDHAVETVAGEDEQPKSKSQARRRSRS